MRSRSVFYIGTVPPHAGASKARLPAVGEVLSLAGKYPKRAERVGPETCCASPTAPASIARPPSDSLRGTGRFLLLKTRGAARQLLFGSRLFRSTSQ